MKSIIERLIDAIESVSVVSVSVVSFLFCCLFCCLFAVVVADVAVGVVVVIVCLCVERIPPDARRV